MLIIGRVLQGVGIGFGNQVVAFFLQSSIRSLSKCKLFLM
jgi:hypothetical protein